MKRWNIVLVSGLIVGLFTATIAMLLPACGSSRGSAPSARSTMSESSSRPARSGIINPNDTPQEKSVEWRRLHALPDYVQNRTALADPSCLPSRDEELWIIQRPGEAARSRARAASDDIPGGGSLMTTTRDAADNTDKQIPVPLRHTDVHGSINGYLSSVTVTQQFHNPFNGKIEAVYVFPLPENAAVNDFVMKVGDRTIRGIIREREQAEQIYNEARSQGYVASLLTEERPNIFTQKVANIEPGKSIDIAITYYSTLAYVDGAYEFVFPMVVGPRFNPPATLPADADSDRDLRAGSITGSRDGIGAVSRGAHGSSGQISEVQYLRPGERSGHDISLVLSIDAGGALIDNITCKSHVIESRRDGSRVDVRLRPLDAVPNKDFVLRYSLAGDGVRSALLAATGERGSHFSLMLVPPDESKNLRRHPLELVFVLDCSGSMNGEPLAQAKRAIERALRQLQPTDTFQLIRFSNNADSLGPAPLPATPDNIRRGLAYLRTLSSEGGTMMIEGIKAALDFPHDPARLRFVSFLTDGYIGNEAEILGQIQHRLGPTRIFSFGVGSSVNRYLMDSMARVGRGGVAYVAQGDSSTDIIDAFMERISRPAMTDLSIDWGSLPVDASEVFPRRLPDLFAGRPVVIAGKLMNSSSPDGAAVRITGTINGERRTITVPVQFSSAHASNHAVPTSAAESSFALLPLPDSSAALAMVWARRKIADIAEAATADTAVNATDLIRSLALRYGLLSRYTAFVAVDSLTRTEGSFGTSVAVPVNMPDGVKYETTVPEYK